jgi:hypothetical protein
MLNLIYNNKKKFKLPTSWDEVSFKSYLKYLEIYEGGLNRAEIYALFSGLDVSYWEGKKSPRVFAGMDHKLRFLATLPNKETPTHLVRKVDGERKFYAIESNFLNLEIGKYQDIMNIIGTLEPDNEKQSYQLSIFPKMLAVLACDDYETEEELEAIAKEIEMMPCNTVYSLGCFFLKKLNVSRIGTKENQHHRQKILQLCKVALSKLVSILVIFIAYICSPMEILRDIKRYLKNLWVRCTGGNNYRVESVNQKRFIAI